ncbi:MAG: hypothetical protein LC114_08445 [Bryobacterales bacterium]|nr:hypothetical protein [Opitutaceae bacterium]MCZ2153912.1 hypothetical protein [Bryobacterales bacterium]
MKAVPMSDLAAIHGGFAPLNDELFPPGISPRADLGVREVFTPYSMGEFLEAYGLVADI